MPRSAKHLRGEVKPSKFKTSMCQYFVKGTECPFGDKCAFAHGDGELRSEQQNLADLPTTAQDLIALPVSNTSSSRDLHTPPLGASYSSENGAAPCGEEVGSVSITSSTEIAITIFRHNPYSSAGRISH